ncbi:hypothetical protein CDV55_103664 [Aspergillus turcosus]|jgi:hypothetical protein|uniref:Aminoglycoside phosphotransferase domain-containing protein n=1 Tax=Penicillium nordicum TaxID=229535 RepID=A0A0M9WDR7_9EURO|nr:hypothetical protein ACN38_g8093 [Penicillium nordicum]RHZ52466.1 hypothetical protein CDV55_103664 [Aspergillus turcosus]
MGHADFYGQEEAEYDPAARKAEQDEITKLVDKIDISALISRASALRGGLPCSIPHDLQYDRSTRSSVMGGMNYHIEILFDDGITWLARIRRSNATSPPAELRDYILRSEVSTLQFLSETKVPAPKVFDFNFCEPNPVGVGYILMEKLPGRSLRWSLATPEQRRKVTSQLADIYIELYAHPFAMTGSMHHPGSHDIGPFARESLTEYHGSQMKALGPFFSTKEYFSAHIQLILDLIIRQESYVDRAVDAFLIHRFLLDKVPEACSRSHLDDGKFYLKHANEKGDQILVDDEFNITGIIDWEWAHTDSKSGAFNSPIVLLPVADFYAGENSIGEDEVFFAKCLEAKGHPDLATIVRNGRLIHRFRFCCGYDLTDWKGFLGLFAGLLGAMGITDDFHWETWKPEAMKCYQNDHQLQQVIGIYN